MFKDNSDLDCSSTCTSEESGEDSTCSTDINFEGTRTCTYSNTIMLYIGIHVDDFDFEMLQMQVAVGADDGNFDPFSSKIEVFVFLLMHSPKPIVSFCSIAQSV